MDKIYKGKSGYFKFNDEIIAGVVTDFNDTDIMFIKPVPNDGYVHTRRIFTHKISDENITWSFDKKNF